MGAQVNGPKRTPGKRGKKAWRSIDTSEVLESLAEKSRQQRLGLNFEGVPDADLFFVDKNIEPSSDDLHKANQPLSRTAAVRQKPLRHEAILAASHAAEPVVKRASKPAQQTRKTKPLANGKQLVVTAARKHTKPAVQSTYDIWAERDVQSAKEAIAPAGAFSSKKASRRASRPTPIAAVEIDAAGCSFNPDADQHQVVVADAVKQELRKQLSRATEFARAPRSHVDYKPEEDELALLQVEEEPSDDDSSADEADGANPTKKKKQPHKKTRTERNREARKRAARTLAAKQQRLKALQKSFANLPKIVKQMNEEQKEKVVRMQARHARAEERKLKVPPRIGTGAWKALPIQVLSSDEVTGSLRQIKPMAMLAKERFNSLEKRALVPVQKKSGRPKSGRRIEYIQGERGEREREGHQQLMMELRGR